MRPRRLAGASSEIHSGFVTAHIPIPIPAMQRKHTMLYLQSDQFFFPRQLIGLLAGRGGDG